MLRPIFASRLAKVSMVSNMSVPSCWKLEFLAVEPLVGLRVAERLALLAGADHFADAGGFDRLAEARLALALLGHARQCIDPVLEQPAQEPRLALDAGEGLISFR